MSALSEYMERDASAGAPHLYSVTVTAFHRMAEVGILDPKQRTELIDARMIAMSRIESEHADWGNRLNRLFSRALPDEITVSVQNPLYLDEQNEPRPDLMLLSPRERPYREAHPRAEDVLLVVEIADSSLQYDSQVKAPLYARFGVAELWVLDVRGDRLAIYREPEGGEYRDRTEVDVGEMVLVAGVEVLLG